MRKSIIRRSNNKVVLYLGDLEVSSDQVKRLELAVSNVLLNVLASETDQRKRIKLLVKCKMMEGLVDGFRRKASP